jgi:Xaa-Pro aminopeptidase
MGDGIRLDSDCSYLGYFADLARTAVIGKPNKKLKNYSKAILEGVLEVEQIIRPGIKVSEVFKSAIQSVRNNGLTNIDRHHAGHGIGLCCTEAPIISRDNNTLLEKGNVFCIETPYYEIGFGCVHIEDTVVVTDTGCERIQTGDLRLRIID